MFTALKIPLLRVFALPYEFNTDCLDRDQASGPGRVPELNSEKPVVVIHAAEQALL